MPSKPLQRSLCMAVFLFCVLSTSAGEKETNWVEVRSPNFRVISDAGEKRAEQAAIQFETIRAVFRQALVAASQHPTPLITVFALKDEKSLSDLLPEYWATKGHAHPAGLFYDDLYKSYIAFRVDANGPSAYETIYHEYFHSLTVPYFPELPLWLTEGLAEFFGHAEIAGKEVHLGESDPNLLALLQQQALLPIGKLFQIDRSSPYYNEQNKISIFYAESWALTHYLMLGDGGAHRALLTNYLEHIGRNEPPEQAANEAFGNLSDLQKQLASYINRSSYLMLSMKAPELDATNFAAREFSEADADAIRGDSFLRRRRFDDAAALLQQALLLDPQNVPAQESMGFLEYSKGNAAEAARWLSEAIDHGSQDYLVYYYRGILSTQGRAMNPTIITNAENDMRRSIALNPNFALSYSLLALWEAGDSEEWPDALGLANKAVALEPGNGAVQLNLASVLMRMNRLDEARAAARAAQSAARNDQERNAASQFLTSIDEYSDALAKSNEAVRAIRSEKQTVSAAPPTSDPQAAAPPANTQPATPNSGVISADGKIADVTCSGFQISLTVVGKDKDLKLHAGNYAKIIYLADDWKPPENFNPCHHLTGLFVRAAFKPELGRAVDGELTEIEVGPRD